MENESISEISVKGRLKEIQERMRNKNKVSKPKPALLTAIELLEQAAEELENVYGGETELTKEIREFMGK